MRTENTFFRAEHLVLMDATGRLDLEASEDALSKLAAEPRFDEWTEVLLDLRQIECDMSIADISQLASAMAWPEPMLPTRRKIAVLVAGRAEFDHAKFLALCASNRGLQIKAFENYDLAGDWLSATLPDDANALAAATLAKASRS